jgi:hypothetical protein
MKLVKYLPDFGWVPTVLTGNRGQFGLPEDPSLEEEVRHAPVLRTAAPDLFGLFASTRRLLRRPSQGRRRSAERTLQARGPWHPKSLLLPDSQVLWLPFAVRAGLRAARRQRFDAVLATTPLPTAALIGQSISKRLGIPLVVDFRDPWTRFYAAPRRLPPLAAFERRLEEDLLRHASALIVVIRDAQIGQVGRPELESKIRLVPNGYDEDDFVGLAPMELPRFSIVHAGQLRYPLDPLWIALGRVLAEHPGMRGQIHFWQVGWVDALATDSLDRPPDGVVVHRIAHVPKRDAIGYMLGADALYLQPVPGYREEETSALVAYLRELLIRPRGEPLAPSREVLRYSRREIARAVADVLTDAAESRLEQPRRGTSVDSFSMAVP